MIYYWTFS